MRKSWLLTAVLCLWAGSPASATSNASIKNESLGSEKIKDITRNLTASAEALIIDPGSNVIQRAATGLLWNPDFSRDARFVLTRPTDFSNLSAVKIAIYFQPVSPDAGGVSFFIRPASFNPGELEVDPPSVEAAPVPVGGAGFQLFKQEFTVPASLFNKEMWLVKFQRNTGSASPNTDTYPFAVIVWQATISYRAIR
jgi:hypothetical protein